MGIVNRSHINRTIVGSIPKIHGDVFRPNDYILDQEYQSAKVGELYSALTNAPAIVSGGVVSQGTGDTLNITAGSVLIIDDTNPTITLHNYDGTQISQAAVVGDKILGVVTPAYTNEAISQAVLDGVTVNYVKYTFSPASDIQREQKADPAITYDITTLDNVSLTVDTTAPTANEILLATFTGSTGGSFTFSTLTRTHTAASQALNNTIETLIDSLTIGKNGKKVTFDLSGLSTNRTLTPQNKSYTIADHADVTQLQTDVAALSGGLHFLSFEVKHVTGLDVSAYSGLGPHTMDLGQSVTFADGDIVLTTHASVPLNFYVAHAGAWTAYGAYPTMANHDAFFILDTKIYFNTTPEGAMDLEYNDAGTLITLLDMPTIQSHAATHSLNSGSDPLIGLVPTGGSIDFTGKTAPTGWIFGSGGTIGSAASGSSERANADTEFLFTMYWDDFTDAELPVYDSTGGALLRSAYASAALAFAANVRMTIPDFRDRVSVGRGDMGGTAANRITSAVSGINTANVLAAGGAQSHTLTTAEMPTHTHTQNAHTHSGATATSTGSAHVHSIDTSQTLSGGGSGPNMNGIGTQEFTESSGAHSHAVTVPNATATNQSTGGGNAHRNVQPLIVCNKIIRL